ncbi:MAG: helix-turn-helix transcriptional regulator [Clostridia bacterium]|nr:helix-turn-helix transcriptional regulator [Clostridia bacterium]
MLFPSQAGCCIIDENVYHERIVLHVNESILKNFPINSKSIFLPFYKYKDGNINYIPAKTVKAFGLDIKFRELLNTVKERNETSSILAICKTTELLVCVSKVFDKVKIDEDDYSYNNSLIKKVITYINQNYTKDIEISDIATEFNIDKSYLSHLFKDCSGMSLWNYVIYKRICYFNMLLKENVSVEETSRKAGFKNYSNFFRLYKKHMKITPMQFKKQLIEKKDVHQS